VSLQASQHPALAPAAATLILGATGRVGGAALRELDRLGVPAVPLVRAEERRRLLMGAAARARVAELDDEVGLERAFDGARRLLLCSAHGPRMQEQQQAAVRAAQRAGVEYVVKVSASPASIFPGTPAPAAAAHLAVEDALRASRMGATCVRPQAFMQALLGFFQAAGGALRLPLAHTPVSWVDAEDVGHVTAHLLAGEQRERAVVEVTGPHSLCLEDVARELSRVTGRPVRGEPIGDQQARAELLAAGASPWLAEHVLSIFALFRQRGAAAVTNAVLSITGRPARSFPRFLDAHRNALASDPATGGSS
jgi:uncharacterized protein YbjT (DUF2867 family)